MNVFVCLNDAGCVNVRATANCVIFVDSVGEWYAAIQIFDHSIEYTDKKNKGRKDMLITQIKPAVVVNKRYTCGSCSAQRRLTDGLTCGTCSPAVSISRRD